MADHGNEHSSICTSSFLMIQTARAERNAACRICSMEPVAVYKPSHLPIISPTLMVILRVDISRVVLPFVAFTHYVSIKIRIVDGGLRHTLHHCILRSVDAVGDDQTCVPKSAHMLAGPPILPHSSNCTVDSQQHVNDIPATKKGAIGLTVAASVTTSNPSCQTAGFDVRTGPGNFFNGAMPNQVILRDAGKGLRG